MNYFLSTLGAKPGIYTMNNTTGQFTATAIYSEANSTYYCWAIIHELRRIDQIVFDANRTLIRVSDITMNAVIG